MKWHPDKNMDNVEEATEKKKSVVAAYECIGTAGARLKYGQALHAPSRLRLALRDGAPPPGFFWLFAIRELVSNKPCVILAASWWVSGDGQCRDETR